MFKTTQKATKKVFQNIVAIYKINSIDSSFFLYVGLFFLISCAIIVVFSTIIFQNFDLGIKWVLKGLKTLAAIFVNPSNNSKLKAIFFSL